MELDVGHVWVDEERKHLYLAMSRDVESWSDGRPVWKVAEFLLAHWAVDSPRCCGAKIRWFDDKDFERLNLIGTLPRLLKDTV